MKIHRRRLEDPVIPYPHRYNHHLARREANRVIAPALADGATVGEAIAMIDEIEAAHRAAHAIGRALWLAAGDCRRLREGRCVDPDGESWVEWRVYDADDPEAAEIEAALAEDPDYGASPLSAYSPTGRPFWGPLRVRRGRSRVLVRHVGGLDI